MAADTSEDRLESKKMIAGLAWSYVGDDPATLNPTGIASVEDFVQALAANFLKEPALSARKSVYECLGLPPPDESGGSMTSRMAR